MELESWPRPHYEPGGGDAFLFYVVYGAFADPLPPLSRRYRSAGLPEGATLAKYGDAVHPEVRDQFRGGYAWERFVERDPGATERVLEAPECLVVRAEVPDPSSLDYLRDVCGLVTFLLDHGAVAVFDPQMFEWWAPDAWRERIFEPAGAVPRHHVVILSSADEGGTWLHTRGMRKFGRPDLSMHHVQLEQREAVIDLFNRFIEHQAFGMIVPDGQAIRVAGLADGLTCRHGGHLDDPEFNNVHLEIRSPPQPF
jgi:hypothetical protein